MTEARDKVSDGCEFHLDVNPNGAKFWRYRYLLHAKPIALAVGRFAPLIGRSADRH